ncbi:MAG: hypothetical protein KDM91_04380, partial [Verrucomicrobiae bacterium]|nr:hypothetical protein [Verrucomicrobiae bacterium]
PVSSRIDSKESAPRSGSVQRSGAGDSLPARITDHSSGPTGAGPLRGQSVEIHRHFSMTPKDSHETLVSA